MLGAGINESLRCCFCPLRLCLLGSAHTEKPLVLWDKLGSTEGAATAFILSFFSDNEKAAPPIARELLTLLIFPGSVNLVIIKIN